MDLQIATTPMDGYLFGTPRLHDSEGEVREAVCYSLGCMHRVILQHSTAQHGGAEPPLGVHRANRGFGERSRPGLSLLLHGSHIRLAEPFAQVWPHCPLRSTCPIQEVPPRLYESHAIIHSVPVGSKAYPSLASHIAGCEELRPRWLRLRCAFLTIIGSRVSTRTCLAILDLLVHFYPER
ncbi:hypothetical protein C8Q74DRAFT_326393 [Fomes fomentarius]|nr:hypothetical protein C8Q74DRAFT_326393 [Fomes fomentarius]